jgi:hypothetical protein
MWQLLFIAVITSFAVTPFYQRLKFAYLLVEVLYNTLYLSILLSGKTGLKLRVGQLNVKIVSAYQRMTQFPALN